MKNLKAVLRSLILILFITVISVLMNSCQLIFKLCDPDTGVLCKFLNNAKPTEITDSSSVMIKEAQDTLIIFHGTACAKSNTGGTQNIILMQGKQVLPPYVTDAAVFLNGWDHKYLDEDHHYAGNGVAIVRIELGIDADRNKVLHWNTVGALSDDNFDDSYSMCYNYTVVGWNTSRIDISIDQDDGRCDTIDLVKSNFFETNNNGTATALSSFSSFLNSPDFITGNEIAILPRGFAFGWSGCGDHHLLQIGYNLDHNEEIMNDKNYRKGSTIFNPSFPANVSKVDSGFTSWNTYTVLKDNDDRRDYRFSEVVSGMSGGDVRIIQPPYSLLPRNNTGIFGACNGSIHNAEFVVEKIPFQYAIPVLSGWELGFLCNDHHITNMGIRIEDWSYVIDPVTNLGTLRYKLSSAFNDKNNDDPNYSNHKITIIGFRDLLPAKIASGNFADLIPFSPDGSEPAAFCRREANGKLLRVTIKNQGNVNSGPSKTTVTFGGVVTTMTTPTIPAGGTTDLLFKIPNNCFNPDCDFIIKVDSDNQVNEGNSEGNNTTNGFCLG